MQKALDKRNFRSKTKGDGEDEEGIEDSGFVTYSNATKSLTKLTLYLDEPIRESRYYRPFIEHISQLGEEDYCEIKIDSPGGSLAGAIALINAIRSSSATCHCIIMGQCSSAASLIALECPSVEVRPHAYMMIHSAAFGSQGKQENVENHVGFMSPKIREIMQSTYKDFLTAPEIEDINKGVELWLDTDKVESRLQQRQKTQQKRLKEQQKAQK